MALHLSAVFFHPFAISSEKCKITLTKDFSRAAGVMGQKPWPAELDKALWLKTKGNVCFSTKPELISKTQL